MVRLLNNETTEKFTNLIDALFQFQSKLTEFTNVNNPDLEPCVYALWHFHQCGIYGLKNPAKTNILISRSKDGDVVARGVENLGFKVVRGSSGRKGAVEATMQMIEAIKSGESCAIMVDGPRGPLKIVKNGAIKVAKLAGVPIVPVCPYTSNFNWFKFPSWDGIRMPVLYSRLINLYGEPIYVPADGTDEDDEKIRLQVQESLLELEKRAPEEFDKVYKFGLWRRK